MRSTSGSTSSISALRSATSTHEHSVEGAGRNHHRSVSFGYGVDAVADERAEDDERSDGGGEPDVHRCQGVGCVLAATAAASAALLEFSCADDVAMRSASACSAAGSVALSRMSCANWSSSVDALATTSV